MRGRRHPAEWRQRCRGLACSSPPVRPPDGLGTAFEGLAGRLVRSAVSVVAIWTRPSHPWRKRHVLISRSRMRAGYSWPAQPVPARHGGIGTPAPALDELYAEPLLKLAYLQAHRRLSEVQSPRGSREIAERHHFYQRTNLSGFRLRIKETLIGAIRRSNFYSRFLCGNVTPPSKGCRCAEHPAAIAGLPNADHPSSFGAAGRAGGGVAGPARQKTQPRFLKRLL